MPTYNLSLLQLASQSGSQQRMVIHTIYTLYNDSAVLRLMISLLISHADPMLGFNVFAMKIYLNDANEYLLCVFVTVLSECKV